MREANLAKSRKENKILLASLFFICAVIFLVIFSWSTSPLFKFTGYDSNVFKAMGKFMADGLTPYKDFFDHKGPVIVLIEWLGYGLTKSEYTLLLLQAIFLTFALYGVYKIAKLFLNTKKSVLIALVMLPVCSFFMSGQHGNTVEEWILPFLVWSTYFTVRFFAYKEKEHSFKCSILYGFTFAFAAFSRVTNAAPIGILVFIILIYLIKQKAWKNILKNALGFVAGVLILTIPIFVWFAVNGAFKEMIHATFIFNYEYLQHRAFVPNAAKLLRHTVRYLLPLIFAIVLQIAMIVKKKDVWLNVALLIQSIVAVAMQLTSPLFPHYLTIWVPTIVVTLILAVKDYGVMKLFVRGYVALLAVVFIGTNFLSFRKYKNILADNHQLYTDCCKDISKHIPDKNKNIVSIDLNPYVYLATDTKPCYRFFHMEDAFATYDPDVGKEWKKMINSGKADYIIAGNLKRRPCYEDIKKKYKVYYHNNRLAILEKK